MAGTIGLWVGGGGEGLSSIHKEIFEPCLNKVKVALHNVML